MPLKVCLMLTNNSRKKEYPFSFHSIFPLCIYYFDIIVSSRASFCFFEACRKILDNIILECLSVPLRGSCSMLLTIYTFASPYLHLLPCLTTAGCRLPTIFCYTFCSLPYCCFPLAWLSSTKPEKEGNMLASQGCFLYVSYLWACTCSILKMLLSSVLSVGL